MDDPVEQIMTQIQRALVEGAAAAFAPLQDELQLLVNTPVERVGGKVVRSKPGEYPRKETGDLQAEVRVEVAEGPDRVQIALVVDVPYAQPLADSGRLLTLDLAQRLPEVADPLAERITASNS